ncbi:MAG: VWA domain-containing protein [Aliarcobacter sp.]|jgi:Ca-activated chloride channel family protein|nr:VWA domain-containing protein [Aliarcobacter sp.]
MYFIVTKQSKLNAYFSKNALVKLSVSNQYFSNKARSITLFLSLIFMIIALARPVTNEKTNDIESEVNAVVIAIDVSKSMNAIDIYPNRLEFAKRKLLNIIDASKTEAIGVILFAKSSFLLSAVTQDLASLKILINNLDRGINFDNGTNIFSTLETTQKLLKDYSSKNLILLTDGGDNKDFDNEIKFANENKINVYTLALGTTQGSVIKLNDGNFLTNKNGDIVNVKLNESIKELSLKTNGGYINYTLDNSDINQILNDINSKSQKEKFDKTKYKSYTELFYYPLALGIFLLLIAFSSLPTFTKNKSSLSILLLSLIFILNSNLNASSFFDFNTIKEANNAYEKKEFEKASNEFKKLDSNELRDYNLANSYYKDNKYEKAIDLYKNIQTSNNDLEFKKLHNLGNAYAKNKDFQNAIKSYEEALKLKNDKNTKENLELAKKLLEDQDNKNQDKKQKEQDNKEQKEQENQQKKESKKSENQKQEQSQKKQEEQNEEDARKQNIMSDYEEQKWLKELENQKTNSLLKKMESSNEDSISNPW